MESYPSAEQLVGTLSPHLPVIAYRPAAAGRAARWFCDHFPGRTLYALKANTAPCISAALYGAGLRDFDVASLAELEQLSAYPARRAYFMNPVKSPEAIAAAYFDHDVRDFALDHRAELDKIRAATGGARDLRLYVRLAHAGRGAALPQPDKFGVAEDKAGDLLLATRHYADVLGLTFHPGSQASGPQGFVDGLRQIGRLVKSTGILPDAIDVGGGFPAHYAECAPPLDHFIAGIMRGFRRLSVPATCRLMCEPGRALVAEAASLIVRVELRRGNALYINDGTFGTLHDAARLGQRHPARLIGARDAGEAGDPIGYRFYGPACDAQDVMPGPFFLPASVKTGDYIEIGQIGAYGEVMASAFNGHGAYLRACLDDAPFATMYDTGSSAVLRVRS
jgi:ornithine decarboxylase